MEACEDVDVVMERAKDVDSDFWNLVRWAPTAPAGPLTAMVSCRNDSLLSCNVTPRIGDAILVEAMGRVCFGETSWSMGAELARRLNFLRSGSERQPGPHIFLEHASPRHCRDITHHSPWRHLYGNSARVCDACESRSTLLLSSMARLAVSSPPPRPPVTSCKASPQRPPLRRLPPPHLPTQQKQR